MPPRDRLQRANGNWVVGDQFWDREPELGLFIEHLEEGANIQLVAQRRMGKTSLMREVERRINNRFHCLQVDLQSAHSAADAVAELSLSTQPHAPLWEKTRGLFSNILSGITQHIDSLQVADLKVKLRSGITEGDWREKGDHLLSILAESDKPAVVFLDEVPILVNRMLKGDDYRITPQRRAQADAFMSWLRENSQRHQNRVRLVVTGSIGLEPVLRQAGLSATMNSFVPFDLGPWSHDAARGCLAALSNQYGIAIQPAALDRMVELLDCCIPHYVQMYFNNVYQYCRLAGTTEASPEVVAEVYQQKLLSIQGHAELSHLEERLKMVLGPELHPLALQFLTEAAVGGSLTPEAARIFCEEFVVVSENPPSGDAGREVLEVLEHDGYLRREGDGYVFVSKLLKDWWELRFKFGFQPASRRRR